MPSEPSCRKLVPCRSSRHRRASYSHASGIRELATGACFLTTPSMCRPILAVERDTESAEAPALDIRDLGLKWRVRALPLASIGLTAVQ